MLHCKETGEAIAGPLDPKLARIGQRIVDAAMRSAAEKRTVDLAKDRRAAYEVTAVDQDRYALVTEKAAEVAAPDLPCRPRDPRAYRPGIGLIGAGGITFSHLDAYRKAGYRVLAICNPTLAKAAARRDAFYPDARISTDPEAVLTCPGVEVIDIATHPLSAWH